MDRIFGMILILFIIYVCKGVSVPFVVSKYNHKKKKL